MSDTDQKRSAYSELLRHPLWQKRRLEILQRDGFACRLCEAEGRPLNVHHVYYVNGRPPWEYPAFALITLCEECHRSPQMPLRFEEWEMLLYEVDEWLRGRGYSRGVLSTITMVDEAGRVRVMRFDQIGPQNEFKPEPEAP
jgi:hypothetical protein